MAALAAPACSGGPGSGGGRTYTIPFRAQVGALHFDCTQSFEGVGLGDSTIQPLDLRFYVHDVKLVRVSGERVPLQLESDDEWQSETVALLDFENRAGTCQTGTEGTNDQIVGTAPEHDDYVSIEFTLGVPYEENHLDSATAPPPLNISGMYWGWQAGYRFLKLEVASEEYPEFRLHVGSMGCEGDPPDVSCVQDNLAPIELEGFDLGSDTVIIDVAALLANTDLSVLNDKDVDPVAGCMSGVDDPQCAPLYETLGIEFGVGSGLEQTAFTVAQGGAD